MPVLNEPQAAFLAMPQRFRAYVAGYGAGKTWALCAAECQHYWQYPRKHRGWFAPTYPQIRDIYWPTIEECAHDWGLRVDIKESNKEVHFYSGRKYRGTTICRSMEKPASIVGFKIARGSVDEIDTLPQKKAQSAWRKIIARMRLQYEAANGIDLGTTPEGFKFTYDQWVMEPIRKPNVSMHYGLVQASTYDNEANLPEGYIDSLVASYPAELIEAYLRGKFVNLTTGTVYNSFDRVRNNTMDTVEPGDDLHIGMDFNVGKMSAIIHVERQGLPRAVDEIVNGFDTPSMIAAIKKRYAEGNHKITIYPDASGKSRKTTDANTSDIQLLKDAGFRVNAPEANGAVRDRVNAMNAMFCNSLGVRQYLVNVLRCPGYAAGLEQQAWNEDGEPDKSGGHDHANDAAGYYIVRRWPIVKRAVRLGVASGF
jgi:hypothetical protein